MPSYATIEVYNNVNRKNMLMEYTRVYTAVLQSDRSMDTLCVQYKLVST